MIKILTALLFLCVAFFDTAFCQTAETSSHYSIIEELNSVPGITIVQPGSLSKRLVKAEASEAVPQSETTTIKPGRNILYGVEVYSDNSRDAKTHATARRRNMQSRFPQYPSVLVFESPFWRVRVGNFSSRGEAEAVMAEIKSAFPAYAPYLRVVRH